jgi:hypothetical protein
VVVDLAALLSQKPDARAKLLKESAGCDLTGASLAALKAAKNPEDAVAALGRKQSPRTPAIVPAGSLYLQPGEERRKSGSHYTPRSLTGPIVRTTLRPILEALGEHPTPAQILDLKLCDPAMGSGAFLVEAARQLGEHLRRAWDLYKSTPAFPPTRTPTSTPADSSPSAASTASTKTPSPSTSPSSRCGWSPSPKTTPSRS